MGHRQHPLHTLSQVQQIFGLGLFHSVAAAAVPRANSLPIWPLAYDALGHTQTEEHKYNSCMGSALQQSNNHLAPTAVVTVDMQHTPGECKTIIPSSLLVTSVLGVPEEPVIFTHITAMEHNKVTATSRVAAFCTWKSYLHRGEQPTDQHKAFLFGRSRETSGKHGGTAELMETNTCQPGHKQVDIGWRWKSSSESIKHFSGFLAWGIPGANSHWSWLKHFPSSIFFCSSLIMPNFRISRRPFTICRFKLGTSQRMYTKQKPLPRAPRGYLHPTAPGLVHEVAQHIGLQCLGDTYGQLL